MKVIFLDIDGPVLPERAYWLLGQTKPTVTNFDPCAVSMLNYLAEQTGAKIVIHSSWLRYWKHDSTAERSAQILADNGLPDSVTGWCIYQGISSKHFAEESECDGNLGWRYDRIDKYLIDHPEIERWVVFDDEKPNEDWEHSDNVILVDFQHGITPDLMRKAYEVLI